MKFKPGDLVIVVDPDLIHSGKIVTIARPSELVFAAWEVSPETIDPDGVPVDWYETSLRPLRDNDGQDETLTWAGLPKKKGVEA